tara:strand:- start:1874 stop:3325 length:1452 start_codon:yes stop_codon:yes gene_type:complete
MASDILGLFTSPQQYQQNQLAQFQNRAAQEVQMNPFQQAALGARTAGYQLGQGIGGALGGQDPQLQLIARRQQLSSQLDPSDPQSYMKVAKMAADAGDQQFAIAISDAGREASVKVAQANKERQLAVPADIQKLQMIPQIQNAIAQYKAMEQTPEVTQQIANLETMLSTIVPKQKTEATPDSIQIATKFALQKGAEGTPEFNTEFNAQLTRLTSKETKPLAKEEIFDLVDKLKTLDPVKDKFEYDTLKARIEKLTTKGKSIEETIGEGFGLLGKALAAGQKKEAEAIGTFSAESFKNLGSAVAASTASRRNIATLESALQNAFTGKFAEGKESAVGALIALGIPVGSDLKNATSNTQLIQAMGTRYIFPLVKNYPGSLAAKELASLEKTAPNALQQPETIQRLVNLLKVDLAENEYTYGKAKEFKQANKGSLINFNEADSRIEFQKKFGRLQEVVDGVKRKKSKTREEDAEINQLKKELGIGG